MTEVEFRVEGKKAGLSDNYIAEGINVYTMLRKRDLPIHYNEILKNCLVAQEKEKTNPEGLLSID